MTYPSEFVITVTSTARCEWQGWVYFPSLNKNVPFQSLLDLMRLIEENVFFADKIDFAALLSKMDL